MNKLILLFGVLVCLFAVNARHFERSEDTDDEEQRPRERISSHRRRRWQSNYGYDYPPPNFYYERRDDRYALEIQNIYRLLEDISTYIRRTPPPPPQPIYIPYPILHSKPCNSQNTTAQKYPTPNIRNPFTDTMDQNRNWGFATQEEDLPEDENDGARPISFEPLVPKTLMKRPAPPVEHGSQLVFRTSAPPKLRAAASASDSTSDVPVMCNAAILTCCGFSGDFDKQKKCFDDMRCYINYDGSSCTADSIQKALDSFKLTYSPKLASL